MPKEEFFQNVRTAVGFLAPRAETDNPYSEPGRLERALSGATIWLTPRAVEGFDPADFDDLSQPERAALAEHVERFVEVAGAVPSGEPARPEQVNQALPAFLGIVAVVQRMVREEWLQSANKLLEEASAWAQAKDWPTRRFPKTISEDLIGTYELHRLVFSVAGSQLVLDPLGRFAPGVDGLFDMAVLPVYESVMVVRKGGRWRIRPPLGQNGGRGWSQAAFVETAEKLARMA